MSIDLPMSHPSRADPAASMVVETPFQVSSTRRADGLLVVRIIGGLDICTAVLFDAAMTTIAAAEPETTRAPVTFDVCGLTFLDTAGFDALFAATGALAATGRPVSLVGTRPPVQWVIDFAAAHGWLPPALAATLTRHETAAPPAARR